MRPWLTSLQKEVTTKQDLIQMFLPIVTIVNYAIQKDIRTYGLNMP
jgi:hypothetical protein